MKNTIICASMLLVMMGCKKKSSGPNEDKPMEPEIPSDVLFYIAGEAPVAVNAFGQIYKHDDKGEVMITDGSHLYSECCVNKDKTKIVCLRAFNNDIHKKELAVMNVVGGTETVIVPYSNSLVWANMNSVSWANDNILLVASGRIAVIKSDGSNAHFASKILYTGANASFYDISSPSLSPDGNKISYVRRPVGDSELVTIDNVTQKVPVNTELYVANVTSGLDSLYNEKRLTKNGYDLRELYPSWSPDGKRLVYCEAPNDYNTSKIISCDYNGNGIKLLLNNGNDNAFTKWSSDGKRIFFQTYNFASLDGSLYSCDATDGYGEKLILKGDVSKQYKQFCNVKN